MRAFVLGLLLLLAAPLHAAETLWVEVTGYGFLAATDPDSARRRALADALLAAAKKHQCDLIVMASHGRKGIKRLLLGSETQHVLTHATIPVLILK